MNSGGRWSVDIVRILYCRGNLFMSPTKVPIWCWGCEPPGPASAHNFAWTPRSAPLLALKPRRGSCLLFPCRIPGKEGLSWLTVFQCHLRSYEQVVGLVDTGQVWGWRFPVVTPEVEAIDGAAKRALLCLEVPRPGVNVWKKKFFSEYWNPPEKLFASPFPKAQSSLSLWRTLV